MKIIEEFKKHRIISKTYYCSYINEYDEFYYVQERVEKKFLFWSFYFWKNISVGYLQLKNAQDHIFNIKNNQLFVFS